MLARNMCLVAGLVALGVAGCSGPDFVDEDASQGGRGRFGLLQVSYEHDWAQSGEALLLTTTAQFVRYAAMDREQVARLLALPLDPEADLPALDQCKIYDVSVDAVADDTTAAEETGSIELLEAGDLRVQTDESPAVTLSPRHFPWLLPFISGVMYGEAQSSTVERAGRVRVSADGGEAVGSFASEARSPELPRLLGIGQQPPAAVSVARRDAPLTLRWATPEHPAAEDVTYVEMGLGQGKRDLVLRCHLRDDGAFEVPQLLLAEASGKVTLQVVRLRRAGFLAVGLEQGELRIAIHDGATLQLE